MGTRTAAPKSTDVTPTWYSLDGTNVATIPILPPEPPMPTPDHLGWTSPGLVDTRKRWRIGEITAEERHEPERQCEAVATSPSVSAVRT